MAECDHNCESCASKEGCGSRIEKAKLNPKSKIKHVVGVLSGKGGVGKSYITSLLAVSLARKGYKVGILDADVTGPSIPKAFGIVDKASGDDDGLIYPVSSFKHDIKIMSSNLLLEDESDPIIWRGPMLGNLVKQFYEDVNWGELEYLLIDMPPGTGDVALTIFQMLPVEQLVIVTSPQDLVSLIVTKALKMADKMNIHVSGVIENMSYLRCPDCGKEIPLFGESHLEEFAKDYGFDVLARLPLVSENADKIDLGLAEEIKLPEIDPAVESIIGGK